MDDGVSYEFKNVLGWCYLILSMLIDFGVFEDFIYSYDSGYDFRYLSRFY